MVESLFPVDSFSWCLLQNLQ